MHWYPLAAQWPAEPFPWAAPTVHRFSGAVLLAVATYILRMPTALLSVYDKSGIVELAQGLHAAGWRIISSGGTAEAVSAAGVPVTDVADLTGLPAILDHRVVTLHPRVHGGLLADPTNPAHRVDMDAHGIEPIDLVVVNL